MPVSVTWLYRIDVICALLVGLLWLSSDCKVRSVSKEICVIGAGCMKLSV